ncbi:hypothetical protein AB0F91_04900 [Amycolatopsis sp. NPDC023774]|uniref:hypothetical protein n=1 Tax=Amycolatopsis sp. NPDC023774 TaxID=3155015 RepID=UPI0033D60C38
MLAFVLAGVAGVCEVLLLWSEVEELSRHFNLDPGPYFHLVIALLGLGVLVGAVLLAARRPRVARVLMLGAVVQVVLAVPGSMRILGIRRSSGFEDVFLPAGLAAMIAVLLLVPAVAVTLPEASPRFAVGPGWQPGYGGPARWQGAGMPVSVPGQVWQGIPGQAMPGPVPGQQWSGAGGTGQAWPSGTMPGQVTPGSVVGQQWPGAGKVGQGWPGGTAPGWQGVPPSGQVWSGAVPPPQGQPAQAWQGYGPPAQRPVPGQPWPGSAEADQPTQGSASPNAHGT